MNPVVVYSVPKIDVLFAVAGVLASLGSGRCDVIRAGTLAELEERADISSRIVILVGAVYARADMISIIQKASYLYCFSNKFTHSDRLMELTKIPLANESLNVVMDCTTSLSDLVWRNMNANQCYPAILNYVKDAYYNSYTLKDSHAIRCALSHQGHSVDIFSDLLKADDKTIKSLAVEGRSIARERLRLAACILRDNSRLISLRVFGQSDSHSVLLVNSPAVLAQECALEAKHEVVMVYHDTATHRCFELYNRSHSLNAGEIATTYGGKGDKNYARFRVLREDELAKL